MYFITSVHDTLGLHLGISTMYVHVTDYENKPPAQTRRTHDNLIEVERFSALSEFSGTLRSTSPKTILHIVMSVGLWEALQVVLLGFVVVSMLSANA